MNRYVKIYALIAFLVPLASYASDAKLSCDELTQTPQEIVTTYLTALEKIEADQTISQLVYEDRSRTLAKKWQAIEELLGEEAKLLLANTSRTLVTEPSNKDDSRWKELRPTSRLDKFSPDLINPPNGEFPYQFHSIGGKADTILLRKDSTGFLYDIESKELIGSFKKDAFFEHPADHSKYRHINFQQGHKHFSYRLEKDVTGGTEPLSHKLACPESEISSQQIFNQKTGGFYVYCRDGSLAVVPNNGAKYFRSVDIHPKIKFHRANTFLTSDDKYLLHYDQNFEEIRILSPESLEEVRESILPGRLLTEHPRHKVVISQLDMFKGKLHLIYQDLTRGQDMYFAIIDISQLDTPGENYRISPNHEISLKFHEGTKAINVRSHSIISLKQQSYLGLLSYKNENGRLYLTGYIKSLKDDETFEEIKIPMLWDQTATVTWDGKFLRVLQQGKVSEWAYKVSNEEAM